MKYISIALMSLVLVACDAPARRERTEHDGLAVYKIDSYNIRTFQYATDNKGNQWTKNMLLTAGVGPLKSMIVPPELLPIRDQLRKEADSVK